MSLSEESLLELFSPPNKNTSLVFFPLLIFLSFPLKVHFLFSAFNLFMTFA